MRPANRPRQLRRNQTDAEKLFWSRVRNRQLEGLKFKRQFQINRYVVDFFCFERRLIIELDGGQHDDRRNQDTERTSALESLGYRVLRFWNNDVMSNIEGVLSEIVTQANLNAHP